MVYINGPMEEFMKELGKTIKCTDMESSLGLMAGGMKETMPMIRNRDKELSNGLMEEDMLEVGSTANNTEKVSTFQPQDLKEEENGKMVKE